MHIIFKSGIYKPFRRKKGLRLMANILQHSLKTSTGCHLFPSKLRFIPMNVLPPTMVDPGVLLKLCNSAKTYFQLFSRTTKLGV